MKMSVNRNKEGSESTPTVGKASIKVLIPASSDSSQDQQQL
jgi:hypothetical protein